MQLALEIAPPGILDLAKLEWSRTGIEVLSVTQRETSQVVVVRVPEGQLSAFERRVESYRTQDTPKNNPKHAALVEAIEQFRSAVFDELWSDDIAPPAAESGPRWYQLWLRQSGTPEQTRAEFADEAARFEIALDPGYLSFPGRVVVAAFGTRAAMEAALVLLDRVAEIRAVRDTAEFFLSDLQSTEQVEWVNNLAARTQFAGGDATYVTLLDTGIAQGHPLLRQSLDASDLHAVDATWTVTDHDGHGTQMAGVILHGNLVDPLAGTVAHAVPHRLESVKIWHPAGVPNPPRLYGRLTQLATQQVEQPHPTRRRTFAMMTSEDGGCTGQPSAWSAMIDRLAFGRDEDTAPSGARLNPEFPEVPLQPRLFVLAAGNVEWPHWPQYPTINDLSPIQSPAQAWNALTVGAYTELIQVDAAKWPGYAPLAPAGGLSPSSTTSLDWVHAWPFKPDVVAEGGNGCLNAGQAIVGPESLLILTTAHDFTRALLTETGCTSAAAAEVARLCAWTAHRYPDYWPETVRGLVAHGAGYTPAMLQSVPQPITKAMVPRLLRRFGYGAIAPIRALSSDERRPTLVAQSTLQPYRDVEGEIKLNEVNLHALPWPAAELQALGEAIVALRVTLSYFVDPNPARRGWQSKFRYQSHALRFAVQAATETPERFGQRINKLERVGDESIEDPDVEGWLYGAQARSRGSLHSDVWTGTGAALAAKSHVAVFPVGGWWKDCKDAKRHGTAVRYALIVSLEVIDPIDIDLYTPIHTLLRVPIAVEIPT